MSVEPEQDLETRAIRDLQSELFGEVDFLDLETGGDRRVLLRAQEVERRLDFLALYFLAVGARTVRIVADDGEENILRVELF